MSAPNRPDMGGMRVLLDSALLGGMDDPDTHTFVYFYASTLLTYAKRLEAEVERLRAVVPDAYSAGRAHGAREHWESASTLPDQAGWIRAALNPEVNP
jgi:hypothetical protein